MIKIDLERNIYLDELFIKSCIKTCVRQFKSIRDIKEGNIMWYMGSKNRLSKYLVPIIESYIDEKTEGYMEPFVGGANIIDKVNCDNKIGYDVHKELIALLNYVKVNNDIPEIITEEEYKKVKNNKENYEDWYVGLVGFCSTFGAKYFGGYARSKKDKFNGEKSYLAIKNLKKQSVNFTNITFECEDFRKIKNIKNHVIYCDPPYRNTTKYKTETFPYEEFYDWCRQMSKDNTVLISEYWMPDDFECIWEKESKVNFDSNRNPNDDKNKRIEKLFIIK